MVYLFVLCTTLFPDSYYCQHPILELRRWSQEFRELSLSNRCVRRASEWAGIVQGKPDHNHKGDGNEWGRGEAQLDKTWVLDPLKQEHGYKLTWVAHFKEYMILIRRTHFYITSYLTLRKVKSNIICIKITLLSPPI